MNEAFQLSPWDLALAACLLLVPAAISIAMKLNVERRLGIAAVRTVVQLGFIGLVLKWVFELDRWYFVLPVLLVMLTAAARAAVQRSTHRYRGATWFAFLVLLIATAAVTFISTELIIGVERWYEPRYVIPLLGMVLGNALTGISLALDRILSDLVSQRPQIEARLLLGAPLWHAARPWVREAIRSGMIPIINTMSVVGLVSLPGMMTGQILAGAEPVEAVAYQILVMFMIATTTALGTMGICLLTYRHLADPMHRFNWEAIE